MHFIGAAINGLTYGEGNSEANVNYFKNKIGEESYLGVADYEGLMMKDVSSWNKF